MADLKLKIIGYARPKVSRWGFTPSVDCYILEERERVGHRGEAKPGYLLKRFDMTWTGVLGVDDVEVLELFDEPKNIDQKEIYKNFNNKQRS